jgi:hypothetical protein
MIAETFHLESILSIRSGAADVQEPAFQYYLSIWQWRWSVDGEGKGFKVVTYKY